MLHEMDPTELNISGLEAFSFDYVVRWPESLILSKKVSIQYFTTVHTHVILLEVDSSQVCDVITKKTWLIS